MTNHVHLLATPSSANSISLCLQALGRYYVRYINSTYKRTGTLWEGRFKASLVDSEQYFLMVSRYIELNPVRASMVTHPAEYPWSSFQMNAMGKNIRLVTPHPNYLALGSTGDERRKNYLSYFEEPVPECFLNDIRTSTNKERVLGSPQFQANVEAKLGCKFHPHQHGGDRKSPTFTPKKIKGSE